MVRLDSVDKKLGKDEDGRRLLKVSLEADTASEVEALSDSSDGVEGMPDGIRLAPFSTAFTAGCEVGVLDSSGMWHF